MKKHNGITKAQNKHVNKRIRRRQNQSLQKLYHKMRNSSLDEDHDDSDCTIIMPKEDKDASCIVISPNATIVDDNTIFFEDKTGDASINTSVLGTGNVCKISKNSIKKVNRKTIFFEDITGDSSINASILGSEDICKTPENNFKKRRLSTDSNVEKSAIVLSDEEDITVVERPRRASPNTPLQTRPTVTSSTPILSATKTAKVLNISDLSSVGNVSLSGKNMSRVKNITKHIDNLTREINSDDFITIDLTSGSTLRSSVSSDVTVVDLVSAKEDRSSFSSTLDSDVTIIGLDEWKRKRNKNYKVSKIAEGIAQMNSSEKGRLLEMITDNIFRGCNVPKKVKQRLARTGSGDSLEDTYIKQLMLGREPDYLRTNIHMPRAAPCRTGLRMIFIDGSNVAMNHGNNCYFSVKGLQICIEYFLKRGHTVKAFVPHFRCKANKCSDPQLLMFLERRGLVVFTPSKEIQGRTFMSYDDRYIVQCAAEFEGVIVSKDQYRDLIDENPSWRRAIETRHLEFTWIQDMIMFPVDPMGRDGPSLEQFLRH